MSSLVYFIVAKREFLPTANIDFVDQLCIVQTGPGALSRLYVCRSTGSGYEWVDLTQAGDPDLVAIAALTGDGILVRTGSGTWALRDIVASSFGIVVTDGDGVSGNPTLSLDDTLAGFAGFNSDGFVVQTNDFTFAARALTAGSAKIAISNGNGVAGDPSIDLGTVATSDITGLDTALAGKQPLDSTLTSLAAYNTNGLLTQLTTDTFTGRSIVAGSAKISVANGSGAAGNPTIDLGTVAQSDITNLVTDLAGKQPLDAELTAIAALVSAADQLPYFTGSGTAALTTLSAFARTLLDDAADSNARDTLGVEIGADVLAFNSLVQSIANSGGGGMLAATTATTAAVRTITGTANQISVADGNGVSGNPTLSLPSAITTPGSLTTTTTLTVTTDLTVNGNSSLGNAAADITTVWGHLKHKSAAPAGAVGVALGTGGSVGVAITGSDQAGIITVTAGTSTLTTGLAATITFATTRPNDQYSIAIAPRNTVTSTNAVQARFQNNTSNWTISFNVAPGSGAVYSWFYTIVEWTN